MSEHTAENDAALIERVAEALRTSRLSWGTHGDRWGDVEWQREFWTEAATIALTAAGGGIRERMEALADEFDAKGRRGSAHFGADVGDTIRLWIDRDPRGECNHAPEHVTSDGTRWPLTCDVCRVIPPAMADGAS